MIKNKTYIAFLFHTNKDIMYSITTAKKYSCVIQYFRYCILDYKQERFKVTLKTTKALMLFNL
jgi:hypothetical protein